MKQNTNNHFDNRTGQALCLENEKVALVEELLQTGIEDRKLAESIVDEANLCQIPTMIRKQGEEIFPEGEVQVF